MHNVRRIGLALLTRIGAGAAKNASIHKCCWDLALIAVFAAIIALPGLGALIGLGKAFDPVLESRHAEPPPRFEMLKYGPVSIPTPANLRSFPVMFEPYFKDRHAFRREAMEAYLWSRVHGFATVSQESRRNKRDVDAKPGFESTLPGVVLGKDGWLFLAAGRSFEGYRHVIPMTFDQLEQCRLDLEEKQSRLKAHGIDFLLVIAPDKGTIYPEYLPGYARAADAPSRLDQLLEHMRARSSVQVLDLRPTLFKAKEQHQVYHKTDSHWNEFGAQAACRTILDTIHHPSAAREDLNEYRCIESVNEKGDERRMMGGLCAAERTIVLEPFQPRRAVVTEYTDGWLSGSIVSSNPQAAPVKACVMCDSFHRRVAPFFNEHFQQVYAAAAPLLSDAFPFDVIEKVNPNIVIHLLVERKLNLIE